MTAVEGCVEHPDWCVGQGCEARGWHTSDPMTAGRAGTEVPITVRAVQLLAAGSEAYIALHLDEGEEVLMSRGQTRALSRYLRRLLDVTRDH